MVDRAFKSSLHTGHPGMWKLGVPNLYLIRKEELRTPASLPLSPRSSRTKVEDAQDRSHGIEFTLD